MWNAIKRTYSRFFNYPVVEYYRSNDGDIWWYKTGNIRHRSPDEKGLSRPATISDDFVAYRDNGEHHRLDGPSYMLRCLHMYGSDWNIRWWYIKDRSYQIFDPERLLRLQLFLRKIGPNRQIYAPNNLGGIYTKEQILQLVE